MPLIAHHRAPTKPGMPRNVVESRGGLAAVPSRYAFGRISPWLEMLAMLA